MTDEEKRWRLAAFYLFSYGFGHTLWVFWHDIAAYLVASDLPGGAGTSRGVFYLTEVLDRFDLANPGTYGLIGQNLLRFVAWQNPIIVPLVLAALTSRSGVSPTLRRLAWGIALSMIPYILIMPNQYFAWGYRYLHGLQGNMVLLAVSGWIVLSTSAEMKVRLSRARRALFVFTLATLLVAFPMRAWQVEEFLAPMAKSLRLIEDRQSDVVLVDAWDIWFGWDLVRNDPFYRERPIKLGLQYLTLDQLRDVCARYDVDFVGYDDVAHLGAPFVGRYDNPEFDFSGQDRELLAYARGPECHDGPDTPPDNR